MGCFVYVKDKYVIVNGINFDLTVFHTLHKNFDIGSALSVLYDRQRTIFNDGKNQWGGPVPWDVGEKVILRFKDLLMLKKHTEETNNKK